MSAKTLNITLIDICRSETEVASFIDDPQTALAKYSVSEDERSGLIERDMGWLYKYGVHPYVLVQFALAVGLEIPDYVRQLKEATRQE